MYTNILETNVYGYMTDILTLGFRILNLSGLIGGD